MSIKDRVWVIDDDKSIRWVLEKALDQAGLIVESFSSAEGIADLLDKKRPQAIVSDIRMPGTSGLELLEIIQNKAPEVPVIIMTAHTDLDSAVASYKGGAFEYLPKPFDVDDAITLVKRAIEHKRNQFKDAPTAKAPEQTDIIGEAASMQEVFRAIGRLSKSNLSVLINGESGTGKELVARALHNNSPRSDKPFIAINIAAIPSELLESELFGHEKGAFTGAHSQRNGRFEQANGGTLFLDEIGDMPSDLQTRLLRVLSDGKFYRVGGHQQITTNVRIVAATNQDLEQRVTDGKFREDLFHRLNVIRIHLPPLRNRSDDIPALTRYFLDRTAKELDVDPKHLDKSTEEFLCRLKWPGNVRQLENTCRWLTVMAPGQSITLEDLPPELHKNSHGSDAQWQGTLKTDIDQRLARGDSNIFHDMNTEFEKILIQETLKHTGGRKQDAAKRLGWGRNTLTRKLKELNL
jgi:two-component system nitrogen regulation response regulator GlnG